MDKQAENPTNNISARPTIISPKEDEEVKKIQAEDDIQYRETPKFKLWVELFLDKQNKDTFGNQTQSAIIAYNLDPVKQYRTAATIGNKNMKKVKHLSRLYYDKSGKTFGAFLDLLWQKAVAMQSLELLRWLGEVLEVPLPVEIPSQDLKLVQNNQFNVLGDIDVNKLTDSELDKLIQSKRRQVTTTPIISGETTPAVIESTQVHAPTREAVPSNNILEGDPSTLLG